MTFTRSAAVMWLAFRLCGCGDVDRPPQPLQQGGVAAETIAPHNLATYPIDRSGTTWIASHPSLPFTAVFEHDAVVFHGVQGHTSWDVPLARARIDCEPSGAIRPAERRDGPVAVTHRSANDDDRVWYTHGGEQLVSWYRMREAGLEQGFTVSREPDCVAPTGILTVRLSVGPEMVAVPSPAHERVTLRTAAGNDVATYSEVSALDASGRALEARLHAEPGAILVRIDACDADYPIEIDPLVATLQTKLVPSPVIGGNELGSAVAVSGDVAAMGHRGALHPSNSNIAWYGATYVFRRTSGAWQHEETLRPDADTVSVEFGASVALDGSWLYVGAPLDRTLGNGTGAVYVFAYEGGSWQKKSKLHAGDAAVDAGFGGRLALQGDRMLIGAVPYLGNDPCGAYLFERAGTTWTQSLKLNVPDGDSGNKCSVALDGDTAVVGVGGMDYASVWDAGSAFVFRKSSSSWPRTAQLTASDPGTSDHFGTAVGVAGDWIVVGAPLKHGPAGIGQGAVYAFSRSGASWTQTKQIFGDGAGSNDQFGLSVLFARDMLLVGSHAMEVSVYWPTGGDWTRRGLLSELNPTFGNALAMSGSTVLVGEGGYVYRLLRQAGDPCTVPEDCSTGFCADGVCCDVACAAPGVVDCLACSKAAGGAKDGVCGVAKAGVICRAAEGACDEPETCDGTGQICPDDRLVPTGEVCRPAAGECDHAEACKGNSKACPTDLKIPAGQVCRASRGDCDLPDTCDGKSSTCEDNVREAGLVCRPSVDICDEEESCNGSDGVCPPDAPKRLGTPCREAADECDRAETCDGWSVQCPADELRPAGQICRFHVSWCDVDETCDGIQPACPEDAIKVNGSPCPSGSCTDGLCYTSRQPAIGEDKSSCGCEVAGSRRRLPTWWLGVAGLLLSRRRRPKGNPSRE